MTTGNDEVTLKEVLNEILNVKTELKNFFEAGEVRLVLKLEELKNKINKLESENRELRTKVENLERNQRKNNLIIFGLQLANTDNVKQFVQRKLNELMGIGLQEQDINNIYSFGKSENRTVKLELTTYLKKQHVLANGKKLKGTGIFISNDLTETQRKEYKTLRSYLIDAKGKYENCFIRNNKLFIENTPYTLEDLEKGQEQKSSQQTSSAPATPIINRENCEIEENISEKVEKSVGKTENSAHQLGTTENTLVATPKSNNGNFKNKQTASKWPKTIRTRSTNK